MALVLFGAGIYVFEPFMRRGAVGFDEDFMETPIHHLLSRKDSIYTAMKDLEFDYQTGKLSNDDYESLRKKFSAQASTVLEEIDDLRSGTEGGAKAGAKKKTAATATVVKTEEADEKTCDECGFACGEDDKFCQSCGAELA